LLVELVGGGSWLMPDCAALSIVPVSLHSISSPAERTPSMSTENPSLSRRSDLDALRAVAMLLGIVLHATLSFFTSFWVVADRRQNATLEDLFFAIHGFRMPVFFVMSGFFSAMLLHRRGRRALIKHRFRRVFLPLLLGMVTIVPLTYWICSVAISSASRESGGESATGEAPTIWAAADAGDLDAIERHLANGASVNGPEGQVALTPLHHSALSNRPQAAELFIKRGADPNRAASDGGTPLHAAAFVGNEAVVTTLVEHGANVNAANKRGETPLDNATVDEGTTLYFASLLQLKVNEDGLGRRKAAIAKFLRQKGATTGKKAGVADLLMLFPDFNHLWFLWFLWWFVLGLAAVSAIGAWLPTFRLPAWTVLSPARYLWLVPLTMIPQSFMGDGGASPLFGPDTSTGILPIPHVFGYYAIFFGFGVLYYGFEDNSGRVGERWWLPLAIALLVVFPLGMSLSMGWPAPLKVASAALDPSLRRILSVGLQAAYPWLMTFGLMGLFRRICPVESPRMRYLSDSAYWLYLAHVPLVIGVQYTVRDWPLPAAVKVVLIVAVVTGFLLWTYQSLVRYTWIGRFLNGPRVRPERVGSKSLGIRPQEGDPIS
jgi:peptidoglycan/LPS O-acetylase OafA/YrhL